jgi:hypothetical protein
VPSRTFRPKVENIPKGWSGLQRDDIRNSSLSNIIVAIRLRVMRWTGLIAHKGEMRNQYKISAENPARKIQFRRAGCR